LIDYCLEFGIECKEFEELYEKNYFYDKIALIVKGESSVYDFTVPGSSSFVANGLINHNSTYMRQIALISLMAQIGSFVPAKEADLCLVDRIFTRIGAMDDIFSGQSTFMMEMTETANILNNATDRGLIILDEIGRGTATFDGMSIAAAVAEYIHTKIKAKTLFATHYHEITQLADKHEGMKNLNVLVKEEGDHVIFLHRMVEGPADRSYGIQVGKLAGLPGEVIKRAKEVYSKLEMVESDLSKVKAKRATGKGKKSRPVDQEQVSLF
jgi:DNA mismatch repair protein MutS